jgi:hypothetical protein
MTSIISLIVQEHDELADLFDHLAVLAGDDRYTEETARQAARLVALARIHERAEERVLYEALRTAAPPLKVFALGGPHEHEVLDTTLDKLLVRHPADEDFHVIVQVARDLFEMHARDGEQGGLLPLLHEYLRPDEQRALAQDMRAEEARVRPHILRLVGMPAASPRSEVRRTF